VFHVQHRRRGEPLLMLLFRAKRTRASGPYPDIRFAKALTENGKIVAAISLLRDIMCQDVALAIDNGCARLSAP